MALRVYLSPHLDDAVFSCGGLIGRQSSSGDDVQVVTLCAGDAPVGELSPFAYELHRRWGGAGSPMGLRRAEDHVACGRLGASVVHLPLPDAIYRRSADGTAFYPDAASLFGELATEDTGRLAEAVAALERSVPAQAELYLPLAIGSHVDHLLTRRAGERLARPRWYYRDVPYALRPHSLVIEPPPSGVREAVVPLAEAEIESWVAASAEYPSQLLSFWTDVEALDTDLRAYHDDNGGLPLLQFYKS